MRLYELINLPINLGEGELSPEVAYFLGAVFSANESFEFESKQYWLAPVRHNYGQASEEQIFEHAQFLTQSIGRANGSILMKDEIRKNNWFNSKSITDAFKSKQGFAAIFESENGVTIDLLFDRAKDALAKSSAEVKRAFIAGAFDGRSSVDKHAGYLALDCEIPKIANYLSGLLGEVDIKCNYNTHRVRMEGGRPRKNQLRIKANDVVGFMSKVGIISSQRLAAITAIHGAGLFVHIKNEVLWGLKTLSTNAQSGRILEFFQPEVQNDEDNLDAQLLHEISHVAGDPNFTYPNAPRAKVELSETKGRQIYPRNKKVSANALARANHKCEIDEMHPSFTRKNFDLTYCEPHHLIPLRFHGMFTASLDIEENIVSLCSNCHNHLHYGKNIKPLLKKLYDERKDLLRLAGINISLQELYKMYNV